MLTILGQFHLKRRGGVEWERVCNFEVGGKEKKYMRGQGLNFQKLVNCIV